VNQIEPRIIRAEHDQLSSHMFDSRENEEKKRKKKKKGRIEDLLSNEGVC
jgi:hypothetical protein